jgi:hypothetical protein
MALLKCNECGKDVSDKAVLCPHCGAPLPTLSEGQVENLKKQFMFSQTRWLAGTSFFSDSLGFSSQLKQAVLIHFHKLGVVPNGQFWHTVLILQ